MMLHLSGGGVNNNKFLPIMEKSETKIQRKENLAEIRRIQDSVNKLQKEIRTNIKEKSYKKALTNIKEAKDKLNKMKTLMNDTKFPSTTLIKIVTSTIIAALGICKTRKDIDANQILKHDLEKSQYSMNENIQKVNKEKSKIKNRKNEIKYNNLKEELDAEKELRKKLKKRTELSKSIIDNLDSASNKLHNRNIVFYDLIDNTQSANKIRQELNENLDTLNKLYNDREVYLGTEFHTKELKKEIRNLERSSSHKENALEDKYELIKAQNERKNNMSLLDIDKKRIAAHNLMDNDLRKLDDDILDLELRKDNRKMFTEIDDSKLKGMRKRLHEQSSITNQSINDYKKAKKDYNDNQSKLGSKILKTQAVTAAGIAALNTLIRDKKSKMNKYINKTIAELTKYENMIKKFI